MPLADLTKFIGDKPHVHIPEPEQVIDLAPEPDVGDYQPSYGPADQQLQDVMAANEPTPAEHAEPMMAETPRNFIISLFCARDKAHQLHLRTRSFAAHVALGEFYEELTELMDRLAEVAQGAYGVMEPITATVDMNDEPPQEFIARLALDVDKHGHAAFPATATFCHNIVDEIQALIYRTKYKLENLH